MLDSKLLWRRILAPALLVFLFLIFDAALLFHFSFKEDIELYLFCFFLLCISQFALFGQIDLSAKKIILLSLLVKLPLIFSVPFLSDDIYRYLWDGMISLNGINPYAYAPNSASLAEFAKGFEYHALINHPNLTTLYLPFAQLFFLLNAAIGGDIIGLKLIFAGFDLASLVLFAKLLPKNTQSKALLIFAFHPLVLMETYSSGHFEGIFVFFVILTIYAYKRQSRRHFILGTILGMLTKGYNILFLFYKRKWLATLVLSAGLLFLSLSLLTTAKSNGLSAYHSDFSFNNPIFSFFYSNFMQDYHLINDLLPYSSFSKILTLLTVALISYLALYPVRKNFERFLLFLSSIVIFGSATVYPWYLLVLIPLSLLNKNKSILGLSYSISLSYFVLIQFFETGIWEESLIIPWLIYIPFLHFPIRSIRQYIKNND
jgi:hypothetical protein